MKLPSLIHLFVVLLMVSCSSPQRDKKQLNAIYSGVAWFDDSHQMVSAHGAGIIREADRFYMFGEFKSDTNNAFTGFSCYSSTDLYNWKFESIALALQDSGLLGPNRVGERPKVLKCPQTGEYIMYMHTDDIRYKDPRVGYATSNNINGPYTFRGAILYDGKPIRKWDMGVFQDDDGKGYIITHSGNLYQLANDYKSVTKQVVKGMTGKCESPAIFKKDGVYFWLGSDLTSWERNDNYYFTATNLAGPWSTKKYFAPKGKLTWNSQTTFVLPVEGTVDTTFMFMGDRWAFPRQNSAATYVWQPLSVVGDSIFLKDYKQAWQINVQSGEWNEGNIYGELLQCDDSRMQYSAGWITSDDVKTHKQSDEKGASVRLQFTGSQVGFIGVANPQSGYARVNLVNENGEVQVSTLVDMYCKYPEASLKFMSPVLPKGDYTLEVIVEGDHGNWFKKDGTMFGSSGDFVSINQIVIL